jgi:hypothetical protein
MSLDTAKIMTKDRNATAALDRPQFHFAPRVQSTFKFLEYYGFTQVEASGTLVLYRRRDVDIDVYHGRQSYEIGAGVAVSGTRYAMSEIMRVADPGATRTYRSKVATTPDEVAASLEELGASMRRYATPLLQDDRQFLSRLASQRQHWADDYALEVLASQVRPQAEEAFRRGDYPRAAELYGRIRDCLTPAELKKLHLAEKKGWQD